MIKSLINFICRRAVRLPRNVEDPDIAIYLKGEIENPIIKSIITILDKHIEMRHLNAMSEEDTLDQVKWTLGGADALYDLKAEILEKTTGSKS
jgi:hypothetical protein